MKNMIISLIACLGFSFSVIASDFTLQQDSFNPKDVSNIQNSKDEQNPNNISNQRDGDLFQGRYGNKK